MAGDGPGEHGAGAVGGREAHLAAGAEGAGDLAEGDRGVVDDLEDVVAQRQVVAAAAAARCGRTSCRRSPSPWRPRTRVADPGGVGPAAEGGEGVGAGVDDGDVVAEPGQRDGEHAAAPADVEDPQRGARADEGVERRPDGSGPGGQLLRGRRGRGRRHVAEPSGGSGPAPAAASGGDAVGGPPDLGDVDPAHLQHRLGGALRPAGVGVAEQAIISTGMTCQETPNLSLSQPHWLSSPPSVSRFQ